MLSFYRQVCRLGVLAVDSFDHIGINCEFTPVVLLITFDKEVCSEWIQKKR
jgi:hypothetical protein